MQAVEYDYTLLEKGDTLSVEHVEERTGVKRDSPKYQFAVMQVAGEVARDLASVGKHYTIAQHKKQICILTDAEASEYNDGKFSSGISQMKRRHFLMQQVDAGKLDTPQRDRHDRCLYEQSAILQAINAKRAELRLDPAKRTTPTLG